MKSSARLKKGGSNMSKGIEGKVFYFEKKGSVN
jgi:hypothetical protein